MAFTHYRTKGIFLKKEDRGEADRVFTVFTEEFGKLEVLGRAIRKIKSKLRSGADLFYLSEIEFIQGKVYKTLTDAISIKQFKNIRKNPEKLEIGYKITNALDSLTGFEERDDNIWQLLNSAFKRIENLKIENSLFNSKGITVSGANGSWQIENWSLKILYIFFLWHLFSLLGYSPELYNCPVCSKKLMPETFYFVPNEGGVVCWQCFKKLKDKDKIGVGVNVDTVKILRVIIGKDWNFVKQIKIEEKEIENLEEVSRLYLNYLKGEFSRLEN